MKDRDLKKSISEEAFEGFSFDEIAENFHVLAKELRNGGENFENVMKRSSDDTKKIPYFRDYEPQILDFLARATTEEECEEIIDYCRSKGDIDDAEEQELRDRLKKGGPRAFGTRKPGYYDSKLK
ncbi:MAG: DUF2095 family protein [Candidatus Kariarchaeaceae archaeon]